MPTIYLSGYLVFELLDRQKIGDSHEKGVVEEHGGLDHGRRFRRILWVLLLAGLCVAVPALLYFWVADRFLLDAVPLFALTAAVGSWFLYDSGRIYPIRRVLAKLSFLHLQLRRGSSAFCLPLPALIQDSTT